MTESPDPDQINTEDFTSDNPAADDSVEQVPEAAPDTEAERPGSEAGDAMSEDDLVDEWGEESFPGSDAPGHY